MIALPMVAVFGAETLLGLLFYPKLGIRSKAHDYPLFWESHCYSEYAFPTRKSMALLLTAIFVADVLLESLLMSFTIG